jgi:hypothetical protein
MMSDQHDSLLKERTHPMNQLVHLHNKVGGEAAPSPQTEG